MLFQVIERFHARTGCESMRMPSTLYRSPKKVSLPRQAWCTNVID
jgi:hypothetical protein